MNLEQVGTFVQEYIQNPLLIDGKKFDIGLYVTATSINPLRVYVYDNDVLLRFCHQPYYPFNVTNLDTYVVGNLYTPIWDMPSLKPYFIDLNMNTKQSFNGYIRNVLGKDPATIWSQMEESIKTIFYTKQDQMIKYTEMFPSGRNFFEMVRFDFTLDEDLNVFLMEANMSPNLASAKFPPNRLIYEPVIYSLFSLTGLVRIPQIPNWATIPSNTEWDMLLLEKDLSVLSDVCSNPDCHFRNETSSGCETVDHCDVCYHCLSEQLRLSLKDAYLEEHSKWHNKRLIPSTSVEAEVVASVNDYLQEKWFIGKCLQDSRWCN
ncbi:hypothetical protein RDWZM_003708 [Blomia tropicalis]|uniref:Uncharacterized protein n=1 Tax=Blomia tropicalis TaxID=40697 RepID=A0A9Q0MHG0_BLOTA|nr:hypothetical protein RDWZM_003708 [Blomia tropicalis]